MSQLMCLDGFRNEPWIRMLKLMHCKWRDHFKVYFLLTPKKLIPSLLHSYQTSCLTLKFFHLKWLKIDNFLFGLQTLTYLKKFQNRPFFLAILFWQKALCLKWVSFEIVVYVFVLQLGVWAIMLAYYVSEVAKNLFDHFLK